MPDRTDIHANLPALEAAPARIDELSIELGQRSVQWTLEHTATRRRGTHGVHLVHCSPRKVNECLFEDKPASP